MIITFKPSDFRDPADSEILMVGVKDASDCDGSVCGMIYTDEFGEEYNPRPHYHLVESGKNPEASPRFYFI